MDTDRRMHERVDGGNVSGSEEKVAWPFGFCNAPRLPNQPNNQNRTASIKSQLTNGFVGSRGYSRGGVEVKGFEAEGRLLAASARERTESRCTYAILMCLKSKNVPVIW